MENTMIQRRSVFTMTNFWFVLTLGLFATQYGRLYPPALEAIRPFAILSFTLAGFLFLSGRNFFQWQHPQMQAIWLIIAWMIAGIPFAMNYGNAFLTTRNVIMFLPFMLSIILLIQDVRKLKILVNIVILVAALNTVRGYILFDGPGRNTMFNLGAFLGDPNDFSLYMNMMIPFAYFMFLQEMSWNIKKILYGIIAIAMITMVVMSFSRGGMVGLASIGIVMWYYSPNRTATFAMGILALIGIFIFSGDAWLSTMGSTVDLSHSTANSRLTMWMAATEMFIDHPIMGVGASNIPFHLSDYVNSDFTHQFIVAHSIWFTTLAESGIVGLVLFGWLILANFEATIRLTRVNQIDTDARYLKHYGAAMLASMVGFLASGSFLTVNYYPHIWYLTALIVVGIKVLNHHHLRYQYAQDLGWFD